MQQYHTVFVYVIDWHIHANLVSQGMFPPQLRVLDKANIER